MDTRERVIDEGVKETFPASDPVSVAVKPVATTQPPQAPKRSPDWMFEKKS